MTTNCASSRNIAAVTEPGLPTATGTLDILTWNLGYAGLGKESDFKADGGTHYFPPSRKVVRKNLDFIETFLKTQKADVYLLQELARPGPVNLWHDVLKGADRSLTGLNRSFYADIRTTYLPPPFRSVHGLGTYSRYDIDDTGVEPLPLEEEALIPGVKRQYGLLVSRLSIADCDAKWSIVNVHLAAFDDKAEIRRQQLKKAFAFAEAEYRQGRFVVMGGDWNYRLKETDFPATTGDEYLFWIHPFPDDLLPEGWKVLADADTPSVRTNERPFVEAENHRTVIDGFIVSPNVDGLEVRGIDMGFEASDHQPVLVRVRANGIGCP